MENLTVAKINADISMITDGFSSGDRVIPSPAKLLKASVLVPAIAVVLSFLSILTVYVSVYGSEISLAGYWEYLISEGWAVILPTALVGVFFSFMIYGNLVVYLTVPKGVRAKSILFSHIRKLAQRTVAIFIILMIFAALLAGLKPWLAFGVPALEVALLFVLNLVIGAEVNRLGVGLLIEKLSTLIKSI